jgi:GNAT superfamily N-acetyltransferase
MARDTTSSISAAAGRRWQAIDPLLPAPPVPPGCGANLVVTGASGQPVAAGACEHWEGAPDSLEPSWGAARRFQLSAAIAVPDVADALDRLLSLWRDHLACVPGTDGDDTAAMVTWPSRDIEAVAALQRHGLVPAEVIAARGVGRDPAGRAAGRPPPAADSAGYPETAAEKAGNGVRIRRATPADVDVVARLGLEVIRFDAHFGKVTERPGTAAAMRREAAGLLAGPQAWTWLAERDDVVAGMVSAERPESAGWIAPMVRAAPVAYLELMYTLPHERGTGIGAALVAALHRDIDASSAAVTLLHYEQINPLSAPFWSQQGYRPLWTAWEVRPARGIR